MSKTESQEPKKPRGRARSNAVSGIDDPRHPGYEDSKLPKLSANFVGFSEGSSKKPTLPSIAEGDEVAGSTESTESKGIAPSGVSKLSAKSTSQDQGR